MIFGARAATVTGARALQDWRVIPRFDALILCGRAAAVTPPVSPASVQGPFSPLWPPQPCHPQTQRQSFPSSRTGQCSGICRNRSRHGNRFLAARTPATDGGGARWPGRAGPAAVSHRGAPELPKNTDRVLRFNMATSQRGGEKKNWRRIGSTRQRKIIGRRRTPKKGQKALSGTPPHDWPEPTWDRHERGSRVAGREARPGTAADQRHADATRASSFRRLPM